jgi:hypothetical protein
MPVKICGLVLDQGDYLLRSGMNVQKVAKENPVGFYFIVSHKCLCYDFLDERLRTYRCNYSYRGNRCSITHDRASCWALGWISNLDRWRKNSYIRINLKNKPIEHEFPLQ